LKERKGLRTTEGKLRQIADFESADIAQTHLPFRAQQEDLMRDTVTVDAVQHFSQAPQRLGPGAVGKEDRQALRLLTNVTTNLLEEEAALSQHIQAEQEEHAQQHAPQQQKETLPQTQIPQALDPGPDPYQV
jgi:hypothetical protein